MPWFALPNPWPWFQPIFCINLFPTLSEPRPSLVGCSNLQQLAILICSIFIPEIHRDPADHDYCRFFICFFFSRPNHCYWT